MCSRNPLGQPIVRWTVLVVRGRGGMWGTSWVVRVLWCRTRRGTITLMAVVSTTSIPVIVGTSVIPLTTWVITLSMEGTSVSLENLRRVYSVSKPTSTPVWQTTAFQVTCLVGGGRVSLGWLLGIWVGAGVSGRLGLATEDDVELQRDRFE